MNRIKSLLLPILYVVFFLVVFDYIAGRLLVSSWLAQPALTSSSGRSTATWPLREDPVLGWALAPPPEAAWAMREEFQMATAGVGLRWLPAAVDMGPPLVMLLFGDEVTFGADLPLSKTYGGWIKEATERAMGDRTLAVGNGAVPGYNALQMYLLLRKLLIMKPHLAMFCFGTGQAFAPGEQGVTSRPLHLQAALRKELLYKPGLTQAIYLALDRATGGGEVNGIAWEISEKRVIEDKPEEFGDIVEGIIGTADDARITLLLTNVGLPEQHRKILERKCQRMNVAYLDGDMALLRHLEKLEEERKDQKGGRRGSKDDAAPDSVDKDALYGARNQAAAWWVRRNLRRSVARVFLSRAFFTEELLPTEWTHQIIGEEVHAKIEEQDLFSWRHRVLK